MSLRQGGSRGPKTERKLLHNYYIMQVLKLSTQASLISKGMLFISTGFSVIAVDLLSPINLEELGVTIRHDTFNRDLVFNFGVCHYLT